MEWTARRPNKACFLVLPVYWIFLLSLAYILFQTHFASAVDPGHAEVNGTFLSYYELNLYNGSQKVSLVFVSQSYRKKYLKILSSLNIFSFATFKGK